jgi:hypothetical protein
MLCSLVDSFYYAVLLFDYTRHLLQYNHQIQDSVGAERFLKWHLIAAREGALRLGDFPDQLSSVNGYLKQAFGDEVQKVTPSPDSRFQELFPNIKSVRHSAAHSAQQMKNQKRSKSHGFSGNYEDKNVSAENVGGLIMQDNVFGRDYVATWEGRIVKYEVSMDSVEKLEEVKKLVIKKVPRSYLTSKVPE